MPPLNRCVSLFALSVVAFTGFVVAPSTAGTVTENKSVVCVKSEKRIDKLMRDDASTKKIAKVKAKSVKVCAAKVVPSFIFERVVTPTIVAPADWQDEMLWQVNMLRIALGLQILVECAPITFSAETYSKVMADTNLFAHEDTDGRNPWDRMKVQGYDYHAAAENIARGQTDVGEVMAAWIESPSHYKNLVDPRMVDVGFGRSVSSSGVIYWVQDFGAGGRC